MPAAALWMEATDDHADGGATASAPRPPSSARFQFAPLLAIAALTVIADAVTKMWAVVELEVHGRGALSLLGGHVDLVLARNPGAAFSVLRDAPESFRRPFFIAITVAACAIVGVLHARVDRARGAARVALPLVLGGALGNLVDRIRDGAVVDFVRAHARFAGHELFWPTFNVADVAICVGAALLIVDAARRGARSRPLPSLRS